MQLTGNRLRKLLRKLQFKITRKIVNSLSQFLSSVKSEIKSDHLTNEQKDTISHVLIAQKFPINSFIVSEGDSASSFYIIIEVLNFNLISREKSMS